MRHPELPVVSFLCLPLLLCPLPSHIRAGNVSTLALIAWLTVISIIRGVNTLVWANNTVIKLEVWCDITTKITIGFTYAVPAAALCILRHLEHVASSRNVLTTKEDKRRRRWFEIMMCFGVPLLFMGLHYIVQGHRFDLVEDLGCAPAQYISAAAIVILWVPPLTISVVTMVYAGLVLRHLLRHRVSFATHLQNSQSSLSPGRYLRLMALAIIVTAWDSGTNIYLLYFNVSLTGLRPYISWDNVHSNFSRVAVFPLRVFPPWLIKQFILQWWIIPVSCFVFFIFLGFGEEATSDYRAAWTWFRQTVLRQNIMPSSSYGMSLPTYSVQSRHHVDVTLPPRYVSEHAPNAWDEISLKMPDFKEEVSPSSSATFVEPAHDASIPPRVFDPTRRPPLDNRSVSVANTSRGPSLDDSASSCSESSSKSHTNPENQPPAPTVIVTNPENETTYDPVNRLSSMIASRSARSVVPSTSTSSLASSYRRSTSSDFGITISEAYYPDADTSSRYGEGTHFNPFAVHDHQPVAIATASPRQTPQSHTHPHGGILMTVETSVV